MGNKSFSRILKNNQSQQLQLFLAESEFYFDRINWLSEAPVQSNAE